MENGGTLPPPSVSSLPPEPSRHIKPSKLSLGPKPVPPPKPKKLQGLVTEPESLTFIEKKHHFESMQQQQGSLHSTQAPEAKRFSFLSENELQKLREEQESKHDGRWSRQEGSCEEEEGDEEEEEVDDDIDMPPVSAQHTAATEVDSPMSVETEPVRQVPIPAVRTLKAERRLQERQLQQPGEERDEGTHSLGLTDAEQRALEAEKRAAWRQARMKSLEEDAVQAQAMLARMTEGVEARPVSPIFKAVDINIDETADQQTPREQATKEAYDDENSNNLEHPELDSDREQSLGHKIETTTEKILSLELHGRHQDAANDNGNCEDEAGGDEGDLPSPTSDQGPGPALAKKKKRRRSKRR